MQRFSHPPSSGAGRRGNAASPILVFLGIVILSVALFFAFTWSGPGDGKSGGQAENPPSPAPAVAPAPPPPPPDPLAGATGIPDADGKFSTSEDLIKAIADALAAGDVGRATAAIPRASLERDAAVGFAQLFGSAGYTLADDQPVADLGRIGEIHRWGLYAVKPAAPADRQEVQIDTINHFDRGWEVSSLRTPPDLRLMLAELAAGDPPGPEMRRPEIADPEPPQPKPGEDARATALAFIEAILAQDFAVARALSDHEGVKEEKIAGLCIVFEEGKYALDGETPIIAPALQDEVAWFIVKVRSALNNEASQFGLEMQNRPGDGWIVTGVNLSRLLASFSDATEAGKVAYSPVVENPAGGESLALFFEYDKAEIHPRAERQIDIVAKLLKADPAKRLRISGHTDALGTEEYNAQLSAARAKNVSQRLAALGVSRDQIVVEAVGSAEPLKPDTKPDGSDNPEGRAYNRRAEIYLDF